MNSHQLTCKHTDFVANVSVARLTEEEKKNSDVTGYMADIKIKCSICDLEFQFIGVPGGYSPAHPMTNFDATELRAPIKPML